MSPVDNIFITLPVAIVSAIITLITSFIAVFIFHHFISHPNELNEERDAPPAVQLTVDPASRTSVANRSKATSNNSMSYISRTDAKSLKPPKIFRYFSSSIAIFNALNTAFNTVYCVWLAIDPQNEDQFYVNHPAHTQRVTSTVSWYIAKVLLVWMLSYRLYYSFNGSAFRVNKFFVLSLSTMNTIIAPIGLCIAYWSIYAQRHPLIAEFAFNFWRILYQVTVFIFLYMFCRRLWHLVIDQEKYNEMKAGVNKRKGSKETPAARIEREHSMKISTEALEIVARHSLLVLMMSITVAMTAFSFFAFRFIFLPQTCITLLIPMNVAAVDSLITSICVLGLFPLGTNIYFELCYFAHICFKGVCLCCAKRSCT